MVDNRIRQNSNILKEVDLPFSQFALLEKENTMFISSKYFSTIILTNWQRFI
jgi:hypothetical protein